MKQFLALLTIFCGSLLGQSIIAPASTINGVPATNLITICNTNPGSGTCGSLVTTYTTIGIGTACSGTGGQLSGTGCSNPGNSDSAGNIVAFAASGQYWCQYKAGSTAVAYSLPCSATGGGATTVGASYVPGALAVYDFTDGSGTSVTDKSGSGNSGTFCASGPTWIAGGGLSFNGTSNCVTVPAALNSARTFFFALNSTYAGGSFPSWFSGNSATRSQNMGFISSMNSQFGLLPMVNGTSTACGVPQSNIGASGSPLNGFGSLIIYSNTSCLNYTYHFMQGTQIIAIQLGSASDSTFDIFWVNDVPVPTPVNVSTVSSNSGAQTQSAGKQTGGTFQLGGSAINILEQFNAFWAGSMYHFSAYSGFLTPAQIGQQFAAIWATLQSRNVPLTHANNCSQSCTAANQFQHGLVIGMGDSTTFGANVTTNYLQYLLNLNPAVVPLWDWLNIGRNGSRAAEQAQEPWPDTLDSIIYNNGQTVPATSAFGAGGKTAILIWIGTNDLSGVNTAAQGQAVAITVRQMFRNIRNRIGSDTKLIAVGMMSKNGLDTARDGFNLDLRQNWRSFADGFADFGSDPNIGADGAFSNTTYFQGDGIHPTTHSQANSLAPIAQRAVNRIFGNTSWTTANTYTTAALVPTATTAGSESTNTITLTFGTTPANCVAGNQMTVAGVTPSGYNGVWTILTNTATQVTFFDQTTGLGAITVQGTGVCPQQQDWDVYTILGGSATSPSFTLESCVGYTGQNLYIKNANTTSPWVITPFQTSETIDGATSLTMPTASSGNNPVVVLQSTLISPSAAGCTWKRLQ